jgi:SAM-dependent methyltransferase
MIRVGHNLSDAEIERRYSSIADLLSMPPAFYREVAGFVARRLRGRPPIVAFDLGCGNGELLQRLLDCYPEACLIGAELSIGRLQLAAQNLPGSVALLQVGGQADIPLGDRSVDLVLLVEVIEHLKDPAALLYEIHRILRPGGRLMLTTPNSDAFPLWPLFAHIRRPGPLAELAWHFLPFEHPLKTRQPIDTVLNFEETRSLIEAAGFSVDGIEGHEALPFLMTMPGVRGMVQRGQLRRGPIDWLFNRVGLSRGCYRLYWECAA